MRRALLAVLAISHLGLAGGARANVWEDALAADSPSVDEIYARQLHLGDEHVLQANTQSSSDAQRKRQVQLALDAYRRAAAARPEQAEPHFRTAATLWSFYLETCGDGRRGIHRSPLRDCRTDALDPVIAQQAIDAWNAAEARAPLDPRFSASFGDSVLFDRAILHTKLGTPASLEAASKDYERYLQRSDGKSGNMENVWSNLAETYMMLGRLEDSIDAYRELPFTTEVSTIYGAAVALDRDERGALAHRLIIAQGLQGLMTFKARVHDGDTFFVPVGEKFYYFALAEEAFGRIDEALRYWRQYINSGAHPQFHPRAKQHIDALLAKKRGRPSAPSDPFLDMR